MLGDVGPFGDMMEPYGTVPEQRVREAYAEQVAALIEAGADAVIVETQTSLEELAVGVETARAAGAACVIGSMAYDYNPKSGATRTMMGVDPVRAAEFMSQAGVDVVALNCGTGIDMAAATEVVKQYRSATSLPTMAQPNAGKPEMIEGVGRLPPDARGDGRRGGGHAGRGGADPRGLLRQHPGAHPAAPRAGGPVQRGVEGRGETAHFSTRGRGESIGATI